MSGNTIGRGYCQCHATNHRPVVDQSLLVHQNTPSVLQELNPQRQLSRPRQLPQPPQHPSKFVLQRFDFQKTPDKDSIPVQKKSRWSVSKVFLRPQQPKEDASRTEVSTLKTPESLAVSGLSGSAQNIQRFCTCPKTIGQHTAHQQYNNAEEYNINSYGLSGVDRKIRFWTKLGFGRDLHDPENSRTTPNVNENNASNTSNNKSNECRSYVYNNNDCEEDNDDAGKTRQHSAHRCCQQQQCAFLSDSLSSPTSSRQRHRFHCHGNMTASCLSDVCHGLSSSEATAAAAEAVDAGDRSTRKRRDLGSRSCSIGSSSTSFGTTEARNTCARNPTSGLLAKPFRLIGCILSAQVLAVVIFFWMFLGLGYSFPISASFSALLAAILGILLSASKYLRCTAVILIPSASTAKGRLGVVLLIGSLLVGGPIRNVYLNIAEVSRSLACSQEQSFHQLEVLLMPYDHMMLQLNGTIWRLQQASENVRKRLRPLERRMDDTGDKKEAALQQEGSKKTCKVLVEMALDACLTGIQKAQDQCFEVMGALGTVYHHARVVLDRINPERWSNKQPTLLQQTNQHYSNLPHSQNYPDALDYPFNQKQNSLMENYQQHSNGSFYHKDSRRGDDDDYYHQDGASRGAVTLDSEVKRMSDRDGVEFGQGFEAGVRKRTANEESSAFMEDLDLTGSDRDICEPLDTGMVCQSLNDSDTLCKLSDWAGEVIQEAINSTQIAIRDLELVLQFREPYARLQNVSLDKWGEPKTNEDSKSRPTSADQQRQRIRQVKADAVFAKVTKHFVTVISFLERLLPLGILIVIYAAHCYIREYNRNVTYDNYFITSGFKNIDRTRMTSILNGKPHNSTSGLNGARHGSIFPLKNYEKLFVIDATSVRMSHREKHIWRVGMCLYFLFFILTIILYLFDYLIFWLLKLASADASKLNPSGSENADLVVSGKGVQEDLLDIVIKEFHPSTWFKADERLDQGANQSKLRFVCSVTPSRPNSLFLSFVTVSQMCFFLIIFLKARLFRARNMLVGFFYEEKERIRLGYLHSALVKQRTNLHEVLHRVARSNHRRYHSTKNCSYNYCSCCTTSHDFSWRLRGAVIDATLPNDIQRQAASASSRSRLCLRRLRRLIRKLFRSNQKCFVCSDGSKAIEKYSCLTDGCCGHYCMTCFYDMNQLCPLCLQGSGCQDEDHQGTSSCTKVDA